MYAKCTKCNLYWNVSIFADVSNYTCPVCRYKAKIESIQRKGVITKVLLRNKGKRRV